MIKLFIRKSILFLTPILLFFIPSLVFLFITGENLQNIDGVIESNKPFLIGYKYNESNYKYLKWKTISIENKKSIWAIGSSRVLQFRAELFNKQFYNAGYTINKAEDFLTFLRSIEKEKYPKVLLVGFDQWMFNQNWSNSKSNKEEDYWKNSFNYNPSLGTLIRSYKDIFVNLKQIKTNSKIENIEYIGLNAYSNNLGIRNDGSMYYGNIIRKLIKNDSTLKDYQFRDTKSRITKGNRKFQYGNNIDETALKNIENLLKFCHSNEIFVVGFLPPFANEIFTEMYDSNNYQYVKLIPKELGGIFQNYNYEFWDFTNPKILNSKDNEFLDGFHGGELTYQKIVKYMVDNNSIMKNYTNSNNLNFRFSKSNNQYEIFNQQ